MSDFHSVEGLRDKLAVMTHERDEWKSHAEQLRKPEVSCLRCGSTWSTEQASNLHYDLLDQRNDLVKKLMSVEAERNELLIVKLDRDDLRTRIAESKK